MKKIQKSVLSLFGKGSTFATGTLISAGTLMAVIYHSNDIPEKQTGDEMSTAEYNTIVQTIKNIYNLDNDNTDPLDNQIGIGTRKPRNKLHIHEDSESAANLRITNQSTGNTTTDGGLIGYDDGNLLLTNLEGGKSLAFKNPSERLTVANGIGIGTTTISTGGEQVLLLDTEGAYGSEFYCDENGNNCFQLTPGVASIFNLNCSEGQVFQWDNGTWACGDMQVAAAPASEATCTPDTTNDGQTVILVQSDGGSSFLDTATGGTENTFTTIGSPSHSSTQKKFGATSLYFDGSSGFLSQDAKEDAVFNSGEDFTIDFWMYANGTQPNGTHVISTQQTSWSTASNWHISYSSSQGGFRFGSADGSRRVDSGGELPPTDQWVHIAVTRDSGILRMFFDGVQKGSESSQNGLYDNTNGLMIGGAPYVTGKTAFDPNNIYTPMTGYLDEIRISKGIARWTSNFTPPSEAYGSCDTAPAVSCDPSLDKWSGATAILSWNDPNLGLTTDSGPNRGAAWLTDPFSGDFEITFQGVSNPSTGGPSGNIEWGIFTGSPNTGPSGLDTSNAARVSYWTNNLAPYAYAVFNGQSRVGPEYNSTNSFVDQTQGIRRTGTNVEFIHNGQTVYTKNGVSGNVYFVFDVGNPGPNTFTMDNWSNSTCGN